MRDLIVQNMLKERRERKKGGAFCAGCENYDNCAYNHIVYLCLQNNPDKKEELDEHISNNYKVWGNATGAPTQVSQVKKESLTCAPSKCRNCKDFVSCKFHYNLKNCAQATGESYRNWSKANVVIHTHDNGIVEILHYKGGMDYLMDSENISIEEKKKHFIKDEQGDWILRDPDSFSFSKYEKSVNSSSKRSLDKLYGYAWANEWTYWATFTIDPKRFENYNINVVKKYYKYFQHELKRKCPKVTILAVSEKHKSGAIHFHALIGSEDGSPINMNLVPAKAYSEKIRAYKVKKGYLYSKRTDLPIYSSSDWKYGYSTIEVLPKNSAGDVTNISFYLSKYMGKSDNMEYCCNKFYKTFNLKTRYKNVYQLNDKQIAELTSNGFEFAKRKDGSPKNGDVSVYRLIPQADNDKNGQIINYSQKSACEKNMVLRECRSSRRRVPPAKINLR